MSCSFVPPYLLRQLAEAADDPALCEDCRETLSLDQRLRERRSAAPAELAPRVLAVQPAGALRVVHTANNTETLPGDPVRTDGDPPTGDLAVDEAFDSSGQVLAMFADEFGRRSVDGRGTTLSITVHFGKDYDNAFWDGERLVFGDGDGVIFDRFTKPMDVMAHEFTHGVTQFGAGLTYSGQPGALNESVSDVFASIAKQHAGNQSVDRASWLIGEDLFRPGVRAKALRSMIEPGTAYDDPRIGRDPQVGSMDDFVVTEEDNGGVHINSGIPNRAFALAALAVGGYSWERVGRIWYETLTGGDVTSETDFAGFARATVSAAGRLYPGDVTVAQKVRDAWGQVKVLPEAAPPPAVATVPHPELTAEEPELSPLEAGRISVRRTGGFAGGVRSAELDLSSDPQGEEIRRLLRQVNLTQIVSSRPRPDRFVYTVEYGQVRLTVPEQDLTPELNQVVRLVLGEGRGLR